MDILLVEMEIVLNVIFLVFNVLEPVKIVLYVEEIESCKYRINYSNAFV